MGQLPVTRDDSGFIPRRTGPRWNGYLYNLSPSVFRSRFEHRLPEFLSGADYRDTHVDPFTQVSPEVPTRSAPAVVTPSKKTGVSAFSSNWHKRAPLSNPWAS